MRGARFGLAVRFRFAALGTAAVAAAFLRGRHLLGPEYGFVFAAVVLALLWLAARSRTPAGRISTARAACVALFALPVGVAMAFPASFNPDVRVPIDQQATDRRARAELDAVFASDPAYRGLSASSAHLKVVNVTVRGSLDSRSELDRLRRRIAEGCPALGGCALHWDVSLRDTGGRVSGPDRDSFPESARGK